MMTIIYRAISYGCIQSKMKISRHTDVQTFTVTKHTHSQSCKLQAIRTNVYSHKTYSESYESQALRTSIYSHKTYTVNHVNHKLYVQTFTVTNTL